MGQPGQSCGGLDAKAGICFFLNAGGMNPGPGSFKENTLWKEAQSQSWHYSYSPCTGDQSDSGLSVPVKTVTSSLLKPGHAWQPKHHRAYFCPPKARPVLYSSPPRSASLTYIYKFWCCYVVLVSFTLIMISLPQPSTCWGQIHEPSDPMVSLTPFRCSKMSIQAQAIKSI